MSDLVTIEINGQPLQAEKGAMVIQVADEAGIDIPRFCYHKKLSVAANCRMCLVEVEKAPKPLPACATPVMDGMKVFTRSPLALQAQKSVMEFLLINHPLDCPICDQGGECELQDVAMGYGKGVSRFVERKRVVPDKNIGPLIATDMTRCIHCTRCVRFGEEIGGMPELGATGRGEHMQIGTFIERALDSELSGNVIDLCPVGALTSKPFRFRARAWEMQQRDGVAGHDAVGSNIHVHVRENRVMRVVPRENESINEVWISDRDRFSATRASITTSVCWSPWSRKTGSGRPSIGRRRWRSAVEGLNRVRSRAGTGPSPRRAVLGECHGGRALPRPEVAARRRQREHRSSPAGKDFRDQAEAPSFPWLGLTIAEGGAPGSRPCWWAPIPARNTPLSIIGCARRRWPARTSWLSDRRHRDTTTASPSRWRRARCRCRMRSPVSRRRSHRGARAPARSPDWSPVRPRSVSPIACGAPSGSTVLVGPLVSAHPEGSRLKALAAYVAEASGGTYGVLSDGANAAGAWLTGVLPHRGPGAKPAPAEGLPAGEMLAAKGFRVCHPRHRARARLRGRGPGL